MSKLKKQGAKSSLTKEKPHPKSSAAAKKITTVKEQLDSTYKVNPLTMRLSLTDKQALNNWVDMLQTQTKRKVTPAKLLRGLLAMQDAINQEVLLNEIKEMN